MGLNLAPAHCLGRGGCFTFFLIYPLDFFFFSFALWVWLVFFLHGVEPITFLLPPRDQQVETPLSAQSGV